MLYILFFCWLLLPMFFAQSAATCGKKQKNKKNTSDCKSTYKNTTSKKREDIQKELSISTSDTNVPTSRPTVAIATTATRSTTSPDATPATKNGRTKKAATKCGKAQATVTAEDEFKFPSVQESVRSEQTDLDELDDDPNPLMDKNVQDKILNRGSKNENDRDKTINTQVTQYDELAGLKGAKKKSQKRSGKTKKSEVGPGFLSSVPDAKVPSVYIK